MKRCLFLSIILFPTLAYAQVDLEADLSKYYQEAKASFIANDYLLSIKYLDSSLIQYSDDSLEVIFALYQYATNLERLSKFDSAMRCYERAIPMAKAYQKSKIPIWYGLMQRGVHYQANEQLTLSNKDLLECISIHQPEAKLSAYRLGWAYRTLSYNYLRKSRLDTAHILIDQMMKCAEEANNFNLTKETFLMKGYYLYEIGDLEGALEQFQAKFDFMGLDVKNLDLLHSHDVQNLAIMYQAIGDLERAEEYFLAVDQFHRNEGYREKRSFYQNLQGMIELYLTKEDYERVIQYGEEFFEVYSKMKSVYLDAFYYEILAQKGRAFAGLRQWNKSQDAFEKSLTFYETMPDNNMYLSLIGMYYGEALEKQGDLVNALKQSLKALEIYRKLDGLQSQYAMVCFKDIAKVYESIGNFDLAMTYRDSAIWVNDRNDLLDGKSSGTVRYAQPLTAVLIEKLLLLQKLWHSNPDEMYLTLALKTIDKTNEAINYARKTIKSDNNRLNTARDFYDLAVFFYVEKYNYSGSQNDLLKAFSYAENNKSFLLNEMRGEHSKMDSELRKVLLEEKKKMKQLLMVYDVQQNAKEKIVYYEKLDSIQQILDRSNDYDHFRLITSSDFSMVPKNTNLLSLHLVKEKVYAFLISNHNFDVKLIDVDSSFSDEIKNVRKNLMSPDLEIRELSIADQLIDFIHPTIEEALIIIPDGLLNYVPFELFSLSPTSDSLLMDIVDITYLNSIHDLYEKGKQANKPVDLLSFAPEFKSETLLASRDVVRGELAKLPGAFEEVNVLKHIFSGLTFLKEEATEANFVKNVSDYGIIHLATHAIVDDEQPQNSRLIFNISNDTLNDGYLHAYEIYNLNLNAQLVTLSACNTGFGQIKKGEGVMSLSRAFSYAGVPATVVSLWPASDKSTPELMKYFYQNLKEGQAKDVALNNARKQYLATATGKARHPFYWGGFVLIGDNSPIETGPSNVAIILSLIFFITVLPIVLVIKKKYLSLEED